jgi:hypothetical protein
MIYDELIAKMDDLDVALDNGFGKASTFIACTKAVRKVIELHKPELVELKSNLKEDYSFTRCSCAESFYPCPTIEAIAKELE